MTTYLDQQRIRRAFERAAPDFDRNDFISREIDARLQSRLELIALEPELIVDIGAGTGASVPSLQARYAQAKVAALDSSGRMLAIGASPLRICADAAALPLPDASADLLFSNLLLPFCADPLRTLAEMRRVLRHPGALLLSSLGPDTLIELRQAWQAADDYHHVLPFMDMHDLGDALVHAGFAEPVLDTEVLTVTYRDLDSGVADLRAAGSINAAASRNPGLTGRGVWQRMTAAYERQRSSDGLLPVTIEVVFALAWAGEPAAARLPDGAVEIPIERLRRSRR